MREPDPRRLVADRLAEQARWCAELGSPLYAHLLSRAADDALSGGPTTDVLLPHATGDQGAALGLRLMAAVHRLVLTGRAPELAAHYPSAGGVAPPSAARAGFPGAWPAFRGTLVAHLDELVALVALPCQTNEVGRCAALVGGFLTVAAETGLPLRLLEVGASAGLNLRWDRYRYEHTGDGRAWGDEHARVRLRGEWDVPARLLRVRPAVVERQGCDPNPQDPTTPQGRLALTASVWADQVDRLERLRAALAVAAEVPARVAASTVAAWLPARLAEPVGGVATVVYHSVVHQYLSPGERQAQRIGLAHAGERATPRAPLAWLRMEPETPGRGMAVRLVRWPGGVERHLADAGAHGDPVRWLGG